MSWQVASFLLLAAALAGGFAWYERERPSSRVLALVAALAALAVVGRLAFAAIPNVKPTTDIVLFAGFALGAVPGFAVGAVTAIVSNVFLSQGPWTVWQMAGWGGVGVAGALLARALRGREPSRLALALACGAAGLAFGAWMDVYQWTLAARQDLDSYLVVAGTSLPYNLAHAVGNVVFCLLIGPAFIRALRRFRSRLEARWERPALPASTATLLALAVAGMAVVAAPAAAAATAADRAESYLRRAQNRDGGFGAAPRQASAPLYTGWAALGLAAAGVNPRDAARAGGRSVTRHLRRASGALGDIGELERTVLVLRAAGLDPRNFGGRNLVAAIERRRRADGSIAGFVSYTAFGVLSLGASGEPAGGRTLSWLLESQNDDGGFGVSRGSSSDSDMTGAVLQALAVARVEDGPVADRAVAYLRGNQGRDGGFGQVRGRSSNAQSTAYAVQGLVAAGAGSRAVTRARRYLVRLQRRDGSVAYSAASSQTPVWVTAQALMALRRAPLPIAPRPRVARPSGDDGAAAAPAGKEPPAPAAHPDGTARARAGGGGDGGRPHAGAARKKPQSVAAAGAARPPVAAGDPEAPSRGVAPPQPSRDGGDFPWLLVAALAAALLAAALVPFRNRVRRRLGTATWRGRVSRRAPGR